MFNSLCLIAENLRIWGFAICGLAHQQNLRICNLLINQKKFADSHISEICGFELRIFCTFLNKFETALMGYSGAWGKLIHEKKPEVKNLVALSL